jgi:hypothetical protein
MIYRGHRLSGGHMIWLLYHPPFSSVSSIMRHKGSLRKKDKLLPEEGGWAGAESYNRKKAGSSRNHSILSGYDLLACLTIHHNQQKLDRHCHEAHGRGGGKTVHVVFKYLSRCLLQDRVGADGVSPSPLTIYNPIFRLFGRYLKTT